MFRTPLASRPLRRKCFSSLCLGAAAALMLAGGAASAQTLKLRFAFDDDGSVNSTTTPSDTSLPSEVSVSLQMLNKTSASTNLHGVANSGIAGLTNPNRSLNLSSNTVQGTSGNYAAVTNAALGFGSVNSFVAAMWMKQTVPLTGNIGGRGFCLGNSTNASDVGVANSIGMKWQDASHLYFYLNTVLATATFPSNLPTNTWIFVAMVYDGSSIQLYEGTENTPATLVSTTASAGQVVGFGGTTGCLFIGNNRNANRAFPGFIDEFRFYTGSGDSNFVENVRLASSGPAGLAAVPNDSIVTLNWTALALATNYNVKRSTVSGGPYAPISAPGAVSGTTCADTTAVNGTAYYYVVSALTTNGETANSSIEAAATPSVPPPTPANLVATAGTAQVGLAWDVSAGAASYNIKRSTTSGAEVLLTNVATTSYTDTAVINGVPYYYVVSAVNATKAESPNSTEASATPTGPPPAPVTLSAFSAGIGEVGINWSASRLATSYNVYRSASLNGAYTMISTPGSVTGTSYIDATASGSAPYFYKLSASNELGEGPLSTAASAVPLTAKLRYDFSDTGVTTVDSITGVALNIVNSNNVATDYHGAANSGVAGAGKTLDYTSNAYNSPAAGGPLASTVMNAALNAANLGSVSNFTLTFWVKPDYDFYSSPDIVTLNNPRLFQLSPANYADYPAATPSTQPGLYLKVNSYDAVPQNGQLKLFLGGGASVPEYVATGFVSASNLWSFIAVTYDGASLKLYGATLTNTVTGASNLLLNVQAAIAPMNFSTNGNILLGNRGDLKKSIDARMADARFYTGAADANTLENIRLLAANPPANLAAAGGNNQVTLAWNARGGATSYNVKRATVSGGPYTVLSSPGAVTGTSFIDATAVNNTAYYYVISAATAYGESENSAEVSATASCTPPPAAGNNGPLCAGATLELTASTVPDATYAWTGPNGFTSAEQNPSIPDATAAASGVYNVTVTVGACTSAPSTTTAIVHSTPAPVAGNNGPVCSGSTLILSASTIPGATYAWTGPNGFTSTSQNPSIPDATADAAGLYSVTATANGCVSPAATTLAVVNATPAAPTAGNNGPVTAGSTLNLTASTIPGAAYSWTGPNGFASSLQNPSIAGVTTNAAGLYSVTATVGTCVSPAGTTTVTVNPLLDVTLAVQYTNGSITLSWPAGTLLSSTNLGTTWDPVSGAAPPSYTTAPTAPRQFFRVRVE
jgi:fibronectin type 3 domain-containing protein